MARLDYGAMDDRTLTAAFHAHRDGADKFTRRMAINIADMADMKPMSLVWRLEKLKLLKGGSWEWFKANGGITDEDIQKVRANRAYPSRPTPAQQEGIEAMTLAASRIAGIRERAEAAKHSPWTHSPQEGTPGHCVQAQVWDENGHALADLEPSLIPELATATAAHIAGLHPQEVIDICDHISALEADNAALRKALEPFAAHAGRLTSSAPDTDHLTFASVDWDRTPLLTFGHFRAAALAQQEGQT